jgi:hypothetical protein
MLRRVVLVRTEVSEEISASTIRVTKISEVRISYTYIVIHNSEFHSGFPSNLEFLRSVRRLLVTASVVPSSPILVTLMMEVLRSSEALDLTRNKRRNILEDSFLHSLPLKLQIVI